VIGGTACTTKVDGCVECVGDSGICCGTVVGNKTICNVYCLDEGETVRIISSHKFKCVDFKPRMEIVPIR
jgi:hypothetical protein